MIGLQTLNPLIGRIFSAVPGGGQIERNCGWSSFWILHNGGIIDQKGKIILSVFACQLEL